MLAFTALHTSDAEKRQLSLMQAVTDQFHIAPDDFRALWLTKVENDPFPCKWKGVKCTDGVVTQIVAAGTNGRDIHLEWLPPTVQRAHLTSTSLDGSFSVQALPRDMQYFYIEWPKQQGGSPKLSFQKLPRKMEEFRLLYANIGGSVFITNLPPKMRVLLLLYNRIESFYVTRADIPRGLEAIRMMEKSSKVKVKCIDSEFPDARVQFWNDKVSTKWYTDMSNTLRVLEVDMDIRVEVENIFT